MGKKTVSIWIWCLVIFLFGTGSLWEYLFPSESQTTYDSAMTTEGFHVDIQIQEDQTYLVTEQIFVNFQQSRHGIYRYLPQKGTSIFTDKNGRLNQEPYYAKIKLLDASAPAVVTTEKENTVIRLGAEDAYEYGPKEYRLHYQVTPFLQNKDYSCAYYNLFPQGWQNDIPAGSTFSLTFPKTFERERLQFYTGTYGSAQRAEELFSPTWEKNCLKGVLTQSIPLGGGLTFYAEMESGYFQNIHTVKPVEIGLFILVIGIFIFVAALFFTFGKDEPLYPSIQFQPPKELDSAAVGYVIDGSVQDKDILSLIIYWADAGYIRILEQDKKNMILQKIEELPLQAPGYQRTLFYGLFQNTEEVSIESLKYQFTPILQASKEQLQDRFHTKKERIYTKSSIIARILATIFCILPFGSFVVAIWLLSPSGSFRMVLNVASIAGLLIGVYLFTYGVDNWYSRKKSERKFLVSAGLGICFAAMALFSGSYLVRAVKGETFRFFPVLLAVWIATGSIVLFTGFMKKRTPLCIEWMGRLIGLRDFIETAELERLQVLAHKDPQWFYHVLPYAYVFGLSDIFAKKLETLAIPGPTWYVPKDSSDTFWNYYVFHRLLMRNMNAACQTMTMTKPLEISSANHPNNFGGGGFSSGGGGFSGGGFGGGGGGSW